MKTKLVLIILISALALAACTGGAVPAPTQEPTSAPAVTEASASPTAEAPASPTTQLAASPTAGTAGEAPTVTGVPEMTTETPSAGPTSPVAEITAQDLAFYQQTLLDVQKFQIGYIQEACLDTVVPDGRKYPYPEPKYTAKRPLDLSAFSAALSGFTSQRAGEMDALLAGKTAAEIQALMKSGKLSAVELVTYYVDRIQRYDVNKLNSVLELNPDALTIAAQLDKERASGAQTGPLHGIPVLLKDNIATGDQMHTTAGTYALKDWRASRDAFLVAKLRDAGVIILGKANLSEWANYMDPCMPNGFSVIGGQTRNPYGPYDPMGSSSGSGAAAAARLATLTVGSETSGSLIQPSRVNSVVGLRPSQGLISRDLIVPLAPVLDTPGPIGRSLADVAALLTVMAGVDPNDPKTADAAALSGVDFSQYLSLDQARKLRVGVIQYKQQTAQWLASKKQILEAVLSRQLSKEEEQALLTEIVIPELGGDPDVAVKALKAQGIQVVEIDDATLPVALDTVTPLLPYNFQDSASLFFGGLDKPAPIASLAQVVALNQEDLANRAPYGQHFVEWSAGTKITAEENERLLKVARVKANAWITTVLKDNNVDVLVSGMLYAGMAGAAGVPALTIPAGVDPTGRPQGVILTGAYLSEPQLLAVGYALEQALQGRVEPDLEATLKLIQALPGQ